MQFNKILWLNQNHITNFYFVISYINVMNYGKSILYSIFAVNLDEIKIRRKTAFQNRILFLELILSCLLLKHKK
jgi:hypothetical protein